LIFGCSTRVEICSFELEFELCPSFLQCFQLQFSAIFQFGDAVLVQNEEE